MPNGILITGLNGCGKSTVCKILAEKLNFYSMDVEDYYFIKSNIPYSKFHTLEQTKQLMLEDIQKHGNFVLARGEEHMEKQIRFIQCPIIEVDAELSVDEIVDTIYKKYLEVKSDE